jgi:hypothetical protein
VSDVIYPTTLSHHLGAVRWVHQSDGRLERRFVRDINEVSATERDRPLNQEKCCPLGCDAVRLLCVTANVPSSRILSAVMMEPD